MLIDDYKEAHELQFRMCIIRKQQTKISDKISMHMDASRVLAEQRKLKSTLQFIDEQESTLNKLLEEHFSRVMTELKEEFKAI